MKQKASTPQIIDVRRPDEYAKEHGENSINIPLNEMEERLKKLKKSKFRLWLFVVVEHAIRRHMNY